MRLDAEEMQRQISVAIYPHTDTKGRKSIDRSIREMLAFSLAPKTSPYDNADRRTRVLMIGSCLSVNGDWLKSHQRQSQWLKEENLTAEACVKEHTEWLDQEMKTMQCQQRQSNFQTAQQMMPSSTDR